jgi:hypothetical protein
MSLKDKSIVVTGGSRGLGLGLVEALDPMIAGPEGGPSSDMQRFED